MKMKSVVLLAVAVGCGLVAMLGVQQVLTGEDEGQANVDAVKVLVATAEIGPGVPLDDTNVGFKELPASVVPEGCVTAPEQYERRALKVQAIAGEMIMLAKLGEKDEFGAAASIPTGMRVVTVSVNLTMTASGMIRPDDRVDVLVTYQSRGEGRKNISKTKTVLEYIKVFATDRLRGGGTADTAEIAAKNISLLVTPEQAALLKLAESKGKLHLTLRSKGDSTPAGVAEVTESDLDSLSSSMGASEEDDAGDAVASETGESSPDNVREFLKDEENPQTQTAEPAQTQPDPQPEKKMWQIAIYSGSEKRIEEVEDTEDTATPAAKPWKGWLQKFISN